jgi:hypothetical protein
VIVDTFIISLTAIAMIGKDNLAVPYRFYIKCAYMGFGFDRHFHHLVEIAIIQLPIITDRNGTLAHHILGRHRIEGFDQLYHIIGQIIIF